MDRGAGVTAVIEVAYCAAIGSAVFASLSVYAYASIRLGREKTIQSLGEWQRLVHAKDMAITLAAVFVLWTGILPLALKVLML